MIRYEAVLETRAGATQNTILSETPLKKGEQVYLRGLNHTIKVILEAENQDPHMGDDLIKKPKRTTRK
jgi:hypothetical protein